jgi:hypothetical protein
MKKMTFFLRLFSLSLHSLVKGSLQIMSHLFKEFFNRAVT